MSVIRVTSKPKVPVGGRGDLQPIAAPLVALLVLRAAYVPLFWFLSRTNHRVSPIHLWLPLILGTAAVILHLIWCARAIAILRARGESTPWPPGFSVAAWFIPFANFALPGLIVADLWKRTVRAPADRVALWWGAYLLITLLEVVYSLTPSLPPDPVRWLLLAAGVVAFSMWASCVRRITDAFDIPPAPVGRR
jgi:hypothetical protein